MKPALQNAGAQLAADLTHTLTHSAAERLQASYLTRKQEKNLAAMEDDYPELKKVPAHLKRKAYASVVRHAPKLASDPFLGGELVYNLATGNRRVNAMRDAAALAPRGGRSTGPYSVGNNLADVPGNFVREALKKSAHVTEDTMSHKTAAISQETKDKILSAAIPLGVSALGAVTSYAVPAAVEAVRAARIRANRDKYLEAMKEVHPDMRSIADQDLHIAYNSIAQHTPDVLKDPLLGGQTLKQMAQFRMANVQSLNEISRLRGIRPLDNAIMSATDVMSRGIVESGKSYLAHTGDAARAAEQSRQFEETLNLKEQELRQKKTEFNVRNRQFNQTFAAGRQDANDRRNAENNRRTDSREDAAQRDAQVADQQALARAAFDAEQGYRASQDELARLKLRLEAAVASANAQKTEYTYDGNNDVISSREAIYHNPNTGKMYRPGQGPGQSILRANTAITGAARFSFTPLTAPSPSFNPRKP